MAVVAEWTDHRHCNGAFCRNVKTHTFHVHAPLEETAGRSQVMHASRGGGRDVYKHICVSVCS